MNISAYATTLNSDSATGATIDSPPASPSRQPERTPLEETQAAAERVEHFTEKDVTLAALIELILKDRGQLHRLLRVQSLHACLLPRLLSIALAGFVLFGLAMSLVLTVAHRWPLLNAISEWLTGPNAELLSFYATQSSGGALTPWLNGNVIALIAAYAFGLIGASGICLPSLYFYSLLAGVRMTMVEVVLHALKSKAVAAVALVGILPIYVAIAMAVVIFPVSDMHLNGVLLLGLILPFIAGLWGTFSLYQGFSYLAQYMPAICNAERECFLRRLVLSWAACYSAVTPIMIYTLWAALS